MYIPHLLPPLLEFCLAIEFRHVILHRPMYHTCVIRVSYVYHACIIRVSYVYHACIIRVSCVCHTCVCVCVCMCVCVCVYVCVCSSPFCSSFSCDLVLLRIHLLLFCSGDWECASGCCGDLSLCQVTQVKALLDVWGV